MEWKIISWCYEKISEELQCHKIPSVEVQSWCCFQKILFIFELYLFHMLGSKERMPESYFQLAFGVQSAVEMHRSFRFLSHSRSIWSKAMQYSNMMIFCSCYFTASKNLLNKIGIIVTRRTKEERELEMLTAEQRKKQSWFGSPSIQNSNIR